MKLFFKSIFFVFCCAIVTVYAMTGREVMEKTEALPDPQTTISKASMVIYKGGDTLLRTIEMMAMKAGQNDKVLAVVKEEPGGDITKVLTHTGKKGGDLQWIKMPNGKVKRIASGDRSGAFVNSHLFFEDLRSRNIDDYDYRLLGQDTVEGYACHIVEALPKPGKSVYDKAIFFIIKSGEFEHFAVRIDIFYDGYLYKRLVNYDLKKVSGIITPYKAIMYRLNRQGHHLGRTEITITHLQYNNPSIHEGLFNAGRL